MVNEGAGGAGFAGDVEADGGGSCRARDGARGGNRRQIQEERRSGGELREDWRRRSGELEEALLCREGGYGGG